MGNTTMTQSEFLAMVKGAAAEAANGALMNFIKSGKAPAVAEKPKGKRRGNPEALARYRAEKAAKASGKPAAGKVKAKPVAASRKVVEPQSEAVEAGGVEFRKGSTTKSGKDYVLMYVEGEYVGCVRTDDSGLLAKLLAGLKHRDVADAVALAAE